MINVNSGDNVKEIGGSRLMTVVERSGEGVVLCEWQDDEGNVQFDKFNVANLVKA